MALAPISRLLVLNCVARAQIEFRSAGRSRVESHDPSVTEDNVIDNDLLKQFTGSGEPPAAPRLPLRLVHQLLETGRLDDALVVLQREIEASPEWAEPWALLARIFSRQARFDQALSACDQTLVRDPWHLHTQELKTALLLQLGYKDSALEAAERLVGLEHSRPESHLFLSFAYSFMGMEVEAVEEAQVCKNIAPWRGFHHQALCVVHLSAKRWELAERHAVAAIKAEGASASLYHDLALALDHQGRHDEARSAYTTAARIDPRFRHSLRSFERRRLLPSRCIPVGIVVAVAALLIPSSVASVTLASTAAIAVVAMVALVVRRNGSSSSRFAHLSMT
jgi:tetratricopeptide (TPR) repeat protein